jgi:hypothetical protein
MWSTRLQKGEKKIHECIILNQCLEYDFNITSENFTCNKWELEGTLVFCILRWLLYDKT